MYSLARFKPVLHSWMLGLQLANRPQRAKRTEPRHAAVGEDQQPQVAHGCGRGDLEPVLRVRPEACTLEDSSPRVAPGWLACSTHAP